MVRRFIEIITSIIIVIIIIIVVVVIIVIMIVVVWQLILIHAVTKELIHNAAYVFTNYNMLCDLQIIVNSVLP